MNDETETPNETILDLQNRLTNIKTDRPKIKSIDWNKLVQKEKHRAFYAGRIHSYREMVNTFHPLMSEDLLVCVLNALENLTNDKRKLSAEQQEVVDSVATYPTRPQTPPNPFYNPPISQMSFMREKVLEPEVIEKLDECFEVGASK